MVSKARLLLPLPDSPVITIRRSRGISTSRFLRLCSRAPRTTIRSEGIALDDIRPMRTPVRFRSVQLANVRAHDERLATSRHPIRHAALGCRIREMADEDELLTLKVGTPRDGARGDWLPVGSGQ